MVQVYCMFAPSTICAGLLVIALPVLSAGWARGEDAPLPDKIDFNRDVRPILSENCFKCHGFDPKQRKGDRRLDTREGALAEKDSVQAIVPGKLAESDLSARIHSTDKDEQMPPPKSGKQVTARQIAVLDKWIEQGAPYDLHWAFKKPQQAPVPVVRHADWPRNAIDHFVLAKLESAGLAPSPEADKYTLCRRVYLDLVGLPPTPDEADAFASDNSPDAYEKLVDHLLDSPKYGERWARRWLDLARYADTNGYEKDRPRSIWPYRDWVIKALNDGMPFDEFTIEQVAGDLLPNATREQRIATGFNRNTMLNEEGGIDPLEFRYLAMVDRVSTAGTTWLGLTVGCAQCHTHKYDPIPHRELLRGYGVAQQCRRTGDGSAATRCRGAGGRAPAEARAAHRRPARRSGRSRTSAGLRCARCAWRRRAAKRRGSSTTIRRSLPHRGRTRTMTHSFSIPMSNQSASSASKH